ncbi:MAG: hypothetical protein OEQ18_06670 [Gammaproteobacteria bacterium]|nr:hypothetical protein [Gammaproteobacteria bacterium]
MDSFDENAVYNQAAEQTIDLGNRLTEHADDTDVWDVADGILAGAIQYWLYSREPCGDPRCTDCEPYSTAELRLAEMLRASEEMARESEYFHSPHDVMAGRA